MPKSVEEISKALKLKAQPKENLLTIRSGSKKMALPFETRILTSEEYIFVHVPPAAAIFKMTENGLVQVDSAEEAKTAQLSFRQTRKKTGGRKQVAPELPPELHAALSKIPAGFKLTFAADGSPRIVKTRTRRK